MANLRQNGLYVGIEDFAPFHVALKSTAGPWEDFEVSRYGPGYVFRAKAANRMLRLTPDHRLESRPAGDNEGWGGYWLMNGSQATIDGFSLDVEGFAVLGIPQVRGLDFVHPDGSRRVLRGIDAFWAFRQWLNGGPAAIQALMQESLELGFDLWRVFGMGSKRQNTIADLYPSEPQYFNQLRPFVDYLNSAGILVLFEVFVDAQDVMPDFNARMSHWRAVADKLRGAGVILSQGNERDKNGTRDDFVSDPNMPLWSRGSWTQDPDPFRPKPEGATLAQYHPRRDLWASLFDTVASPVTIWSRDGVTVPLIVDEPPRFGTNGSGPEYLDPKLTWKFFRHYATEFAAAVFHNYFSQRGLLMDGPTRDCARQAVLGMKI